MAVTQPAWKVGDPSPAGGGELVHYRPATKEEWAAYTHREAPRMLPPRVDTASPEQVAELGELWVDEATGYKTRVKPDANADETRGREARQRDERGAAGRDDASRGAAATNQDQGSGAPAGAADPTQELARLRAENDRLRAGGAGGPS